MAKPRSTFFGFSPTEIARRQKRQRGPTAQKGLRQPAPPVGRSYQPLDWLQTLHPDSIAVISTGTPATEAGTAPELGPNNVIAAAPAKSKKLCVLINAPGAVTLISEETCLQ